MSKIPHSKTKISFEHAVLKVIYFETVTEISRSINPDVFVDNMKRSSDLQNIWSYCVIQMLKRQARLKEAVGCKYLHVGIWRLAFVWVDINVYMHLRRM